MRAGLGEEGAGGAGRQRRIGGTTATTVTEAAARAATRASSMASSMEERCVERRRLGREDMAARGTTVMESAVRR